MSLTRLVIEGLVKKPVNCTYNEVLDGFTGYKKSVTLHYDENWSVTILWKAVLLRDIISRSNPAQQANTVIFHAYDGYTTSFPIGYIMNNDILLAHEMNNITLSP